MQHLVTPFTWFGGKAKIVEPLNARFGNVRHRIDAFCGAAAWFLMSPPVPWETLNDVNGDVINAYRAIRADPDAVAYYCDFPVSEVDLAARRVVLKDTLPERAARCAADPDWYDAKAAGYFLYVLAVGIRAQTYARGPWIVEDGQLVRRQGADGVIKQLPKLTQNLKITSVRRRSDLGPWLRSIAERLRCVRITCGDWRRVLSLSPRRQIAGATAVLLDPPYPQRMHGIKYEAAPDNDVWYEAVDWAIAHQHEPDFRIAVCGYWTPETDALFPSDWERMRWIATGGYTKRKDTSKRFLECVWFSPQCIRPDQHKQNGLTSD